MKESIFTNPIFINPQAYIVIPELAIIDQYIPLSSNEYTFKTNIGNGKIDCKILKGQENTSILHLDYYGILGNVILGEFIINLKYDDVKDNFVVIYNKNYITVQFNQKLKPIASYRTYDKTNDDADRNVLTDLTGNGHDIQLYNFAYSESSGYGKYATDFTNWIDGIGIIKQSNKFIITTEYTGNAIMYFYINDNTSDIPSFTVKISGLNFNWTYKYVNEDGAIATFKLQEGINKLPVSYISLYTGNRTWVGFSNVSTSSITDNVIVEQIPDYQGALVSDGVDDYGLCENFPILTKENGYTVCAIRERIDNNEPYTLFSILNAFSFEEFLNGKFNSYSFGAGQNNLEYNNDIFTYQKSISYNGTPIIKGITEPIDILTISSGYFRNSARYFAKNALYALEIYDRDLTDEEIAKVKERMIAEYEEKTGNIYTEETT